MSDEMATKLAYAQVKEWDRVIRAGIEAADGVVSENDEYLKANGKILVNADGSREFYWKGKMVAKQWPPKL